MNDNEYHTAEEQEDEQDRSEPESESEAESGSDSDSDDAPIEESTTGINESILAKQKRELKAKQELKELEKEKRRQQNVHNQKQQLFKKGKKPLQEDLPEYLPEDLIESLDDIPEPELITPSKHLKLSDFDEYDENEIRRKIKESKLKEIKKNKKLSIKRGPVHVKVLQFDSKKVVPKSENKIVNARNKWLKRKTLGKK